MDASHVNVDTPRPEATRQPDPAKQRERAAHHKVQADIAIAIILCANAPSPACKHQFVRSVIVDTEAEQHGDIPKFHDPTESRPDDSGTGAERRYPWHKEWGF
jgi:hypothetical protein